MSVEAVGRKGRRKGYRVRYRDHAGKPRTETFDLKADADARDAAIRQAKQRKEPIPPLGRGSGGQTFEAFARDEWWPLYVEGRKLAPKTREIYGWTLDKHVIPYIGDDALAYIDVARIFEVRAQLANSAPGYTSAQALKLIRQVLAFAVQLGRLPFNPADVLRARGSLPPQARRTDIRPLDPTEVEAIRTAMVGRRSAHGLRDATLVSLLAYAGLRPEEALALRWEHVGTSSLRIEHANSDGHIGPTKTSERRTVRPLIGPLVDDLKTWRKASGDPAPTALVIPADDGSPWDRWQYANWRRRTFKPNAPAGATPYSCRHGFASLLIRAGRPLAEVAAVMGHSPTMTTQHYTHVMERFRDEPSQPVEKLVTAARSVQKVSAPAA